MSDEAVDLDEEKYYTLEAKITENISLHISFFIYFLSLCPSQEAEQSPDRRGQV